MSKICVKCSTENQDNFSFCKNCGAALPKTAAAQTDNPNTQPLTTFEDRALEIDFDGVTFTELETYVGKNAKKIMPKFISLKLFGRKVSLSFPVLILGFLFGFYGMAVYFFSRKVFPVALALTLCGVAFSGAQIAAKYEADKAFFSEYSAIVNQIFENPEESAQNLEENMLNAYENYTAALGTKEYSFVSFIDLWVVRSMLPVILSGFATYFYYKSAVRRIKKVKETYIESEPYIKRAGGFSVGLIFIPIAVNFAMSVLSVILVMI